MERQIAYRALADQLKSELYAGKYDDGSALPTEFQLAETHKVSRQTVRRAVQDLVAAGLVYRVAGRGTFARPRTERFISDFSSVDDLLTIAPLTLCEIVEPLALRKDADAARALQTDGKVYTVAMRRFQGTIPIGYTRVAMPVHVGEKLRDEAKLINKGISELKTVIGLIEARMPGIVTATEQSVTAMPPSDDVKERIKLGDGEYVLRVDRLYLSADNQPIEWAVNYFHSAHFVYRVRLRREAR